MISRRTDGGKKEEAKSSSIFVRFCVRVSREMDGWNVERDRDIEMCKEKDPDGRKKKTEKSRRGRLSWLAG